MVCIRNNIRDTDVIYRHKQWVKSKIIQQMEQDDAGVGALPLIMDEKVKLLQQILENGEDPPALEKATSAQPEISSPKDNDNSIQEPEIEDKKSQRKKKKLNSGYKPQSTDMPTKLNKTRKPIKKVIIEDCVQLGLLKKKRAKYLITQMAGKQPADAEKEIVKELRDNLHKQIRKLIRKDKKGPWSSPKAQEELRIEIIQTPAVRSVVYLTREILRERDEWKQRSRNSITGRIFGSRMTVGKDK
ncbi:MAG: hypothetical protein GY814_10505 [Gammaproteobacteria bacterium]|nr:hypothetical protein [Gammaproteobacteria bacterium]